MQTYLLDGISLSYLELSQAEAVSYISRGLQEFCAYYSNQMSYAEVAGIVARQCGARVLSPQAIWQLVQDQALQLSDRIERSTLKGLSNPVIKVASPIDLYDPASAEVVLLDDAIGVKAQKPQRQRPPRPVLETPTHPQTVSTDVVLLQTAPQQFEYVSAPIDEDGSLRLPIETVVQARVQQVYAGSTQPLPLVVISDGAQAIRNRWRSTFGSGVVFLLDWYHLGEKLRQLLSMIA